MVVTDDSRNAIEPEKVLLLFLDNASAAFYSDFVGHDLEVI